MYKVILFLFSTLYFLTASGQQNELIYKVVLPPSTNLQVNQDGSVYTITYFWNYDPDSTINIGIWEPQYENLIYDGIFYENATVAYNAQLEPVGVFYNYWLPDAYPISMENILLNVNKYFVQSDYPTIPTVPNLTSYPSSTFGTGIFIKFNPAEETATGLLNFSSAYLNPANLEPYTGYYNAVNAGTFPPRFYKPTAVLGDSILITYLSLWSQQYLNQNLEFNNWGGQENLVRASLNMETNVLSSQQIGSATGSQTTFLVESAKNDLSLYRVGLVRGNDTPVSISGAEVEMGVNDSLYHVFITKEFANGQTQWLTELYAYNNTNSDTAQYTDAIQVQNRVFSLIENDASIYVSASLVSKSELTDSLLFRDFLGNDSLYNSELPFGGWSILQIPYSKCSIYKLDQNGEVKVELSYVRQLYQYEYEPGFHGSSQGNYLFEVADKLAWVHLYYVPTDTTAVFTYKMEDGTQENVSLDFEAGKGSSILWLDSDLNILEHWIIPYENDYITGLYINYVGVFQDDTLLIQGTMRPGTTTNLDPFGNAAADSTSTGFGTFFAFYSAPEILTSSKNPEAIQALQIYPNPVHDYLSISGVIPPNSRYMIFDLSGRLISTGTLNRNQFIDVQSLHAGMYLLTITSGQTRNTFKFVVG